MRRSLNSQARRIVLAAVVGLQLPLVCAVAGIAVALREPILESYCRWREDRMDNAGWLPQAEDVTQVRAYVREVNSAAEVSWRSVELPDEAIPRLLDCLSHRHAPVYPKHKPGDPLVHYDTSARIQIELIVPQRRRPVSVGLVKSRLAWVGRRLVVIPPDDGERLGELVTDCDLSNPQ